jgi:hypothetical protein
VECPQRLQAQRVPLPLYIAAFTSQLPCKVVSVRQSQFLRLLRSRVRAVSVPRAARLSGVQVGGPCRPHGPPASLSVRCFALYVASLIVFALSAALRRFSALRRVTVDVFPPAIFFLVFPAAMQSRLLCCRVQPMPPFSLSASDCLQFSAPLTPLSWTQKQCCLMNVLLSLLVWAPSFSACVASLTLFALSALFEFF